jgi:hypothetical protein
MRHNLCWLWLMFPFPVTPTELECSSQMLTRCPLFSPRGQSATYIYIYVPVRAQTFLTHTASEPTRELIVFLLI